jgi:hypothetical protein
MRIEDKLVIELCKKNKNRKQISLLAAKDRFNMDYFLKIIEKHLLKAFVLSELLKCKIPYEIKKRLLPVAKESLAETTVYNRKIREEYIQTASILNMNKIETVLMKGESLNFSGLRYYRDLDILVREERLLESIDILSGKGYRYIGDSINLLLDSDEKKDLSFQLKWNNQFQMINEDTGIMIELHTNLFERDRAYSIILNPLLDSIDSFWENRKWNSKLEVFEFSIEENMLLMCMHTAIKRSPASNRFVLRNLVDIKNLIDKKPDWNIFLDQVKKCKICSFIYFSLSLTSTLFGTDVPPHVLNELKVNSTEKELFIERIHWNSFQSLERNSILFSNLYKMFSPFIYHSSMKVKLQNLFLFPVLFPSKWRMAHIYNVKGSNPIIYLSYILNPFRWFYIIIRNLFRKR